MRLPLFVLVSCLLFGCTPKASQVPTKAAPGRPLAAPAPPPPPPPPVDKQRDARALEAVEIDESLSREAVELQTYDPTEGNEPNQPLRVDDPEAEKAQLIDEMKRRRAEARAARATEAANADGASPQPTRPNRPANMTIRDARDDQPARTEQTEPLPSAMTLENTPPSFSVSTSSCYGNCAQYTFRMLPDNLVHLNARKNMDREGNFAIRLNYDQTVELTKLYNDVAPIILEPFYPTDEEAPVDLQTTYYRFTDMDGQDRKVGVVYGAPPELHALFDYVDEMVKNGNWTPVK